MLGGGSNHQVAHLESVKAAHLYGDQHIGGIDIDTCRNFFGRQTKSFETFSHSSAAEFEKFPCVFIRAPAIVTVGREATRLATIVYNKEEIVVAAKQGSLLVTCFHPELTKDRRIHQYFINLVVKQKTNS